MKISLVHLNPLKSRFNVPADGQRLSKPAKLEIFWWNNNINIATDIDTWHLYLSRIHAHTSLTYSDKCSHNWAYHTIANDSVIATLYECAS